VAGGPVTGVRGPTATWQDHRAGDERGSRFSPWTHEAVTRILHRRQIPLFLPVNATAGPPRDLRGNWGSCERGIGEPSQQQPGTGRRTWWCWGTVAVLVLLTLYCCCCFAICIVRTDRRSSNSNWLNRTISSTFFSVLNRELPRLVPRTWQQHAAPRSVKSRWTDLPARCDPRRERASCEQT
jgi:hypothetical protein